MNDSMPLDQPQTLSPWRFQGNIDSLSNYIQECIAGRPDEKILKEQWKNSSNRFNRYLLVRVNQLFLECLQTKYQLTKDQLYQHAERSGHILCHPLVAIHYGIWISPEFSLFCTDLVFSFLFGTHGKERAEDAQLKEIQKLINENQRLIDENQKLIDENQRLSKNLKTAYFATDGEVDHHIELTSSTNCQVLKSTPRSTLIRPTDDTTYPQIILFLNTEDRLRFANIPNGPDTIVQAIDEILYAPSETDKGLA